MGHAHGPASAGVPGATGGDAQAGEAAQGLQCVEADQQLFAFDESGSRVEARRKSVGPAEKGYAEVDLLEDALYQVSLVRGARVTDQVRVAPARKPA